ncbi:MAG: tetratricopeptide repeat protein [Magnetococcales bacterium]|nr:tetratricopeptide repeat protein [Magnetococcales bacterium]
MTNKVTNTQTNDQLIQQANAHYADGNYAAAGKVANTVYENDPNNPDGLFILGMVAFKLGNHKMAIQLIEGSLTLRPKQANVLFHLATVLQNNNQIEDAEIRLAQALKINPYMVEAHINLGNICFGNNNPSMALNHYAAALKSDKDNSMAHYNIGVIAQKYGDQILALSHLQKALIQAPDSAPVHMAIAFSLLITEQFKQGWQEYEWRWKLPTNTPRICPIPRWEGEELEGGKRLYLYTEQGFGDAIMCARYIQWVQESGAYVILECKPELLLLFQESNIADMVVAREKDDETPPNFKYDYHIPLMSLPSLFTNSLATIPKNVPYLKPKPSDATQWRLRLRTGKELNVGICWSGNPTAKANQGRACTFDDMLPITKVPGVRFYSLQKGTPARELQTAQNEQVVVDLDPVLTDFAQTAACLCNLDLLISTDTAVVHLAGAINTKCWVMLHTASEWRWLANRNDSPWYPNTTLFRQTSPDHWETVVSQVCLELQKMVEENQ